MRIIWDSDNQPTLRWHILGNIFCSGLFCGYPLDTHTKMAHYGATLRLGGDTVVIKKLLICHLTVPNLYAIYISKNVGKFGKWTDMDGWMDKLRGRQWIKGNFCRQLPCRITCTYPSLSCTTGWLSSIGKSKTSILDAVEVLELFESSHGRWRTWILCHCSDTHWGGHINQWVQAKDAALRGWRSRE